MTEESPEHTSHIDKIWEGDMLDRRKEALVLERFLISETEAMRKQGRDQAVVLALDAQYGEGKSWFLSRLRQQIEINHPVAFIDAWIDDANEEPLISIMAALDDALRPFLKAEVVRSKLATLTRAALPIIGKAVIGAGGKAASRYLGDQFGEDVKGVLTKEAKKEDSSPLDAAIDKMVDGVSEVVDNTAQAMVDQYRNRQRSREVFKENLRQLASSIDSSEGDPRKAPIFVIIDELDRCRPSYAIRLLEDIKHLFDVSGLVFVIALHGSQLTESIKAIYGDGFDAVSYLRRFFSRHYQLRKLSIRELVISHLAWIPIKEGQFSCPQIWDGDRIVNPDPGDVAGRLLSDWDVTPREALAIVDGLRLFVGDWDHNSPIELPFILSLLRSLVRGEELRLVSPALRSQSISFVGPRNQGSPPERVTISDYFHAYSGAASAPLPDSSSNRDRHNGWEYVSMIMRAEFSARYNNSYIPGQEPRSTWSEYADRLKRLGRFLD